MEKIIRLGKVDYYGRGKRINAVDVEINYKIDNDKKVLSICGNIWNGNHTDIVSGGQNLDTIAEYIDTPLFKKIYRLWKLYHLNDMHPECEHQRELGWLKESDHPEGILSKPCPVCGYKYGTSWNYVPIPEEDEKILKEILGI